MSEEENEELQRRKLLELRRRLAEEQQRAQVQRQIEIQKEALLRRILTSDARSRLTNLKMVRPEFAQQLELELIQLAQQGRINIPVTDEQLKEILVKIQSGRREFKIRRV